MAQDTVQQKPGRPSGGSTRLRKLMIKVSAEQRRALQDRANRLFDGNVSELLRTAALEYEPVKKR